MAGVVGPWGQPVDQHLAPDDEHLHRHHPDEPELLGDVDAQLRSLVLPAGRKIGRHVADVEDAVHVLVLGHRVGGGAAVGATGQHQRQLTGEVEPLLEHARHPTELLPRRGQFARGGTANLPLALVAEAGGLQDRRKADGGGRGRDVGIGLDHSVRPDIDPDVVEESLLGDAVLADTDGRRRWVHEGAPDEPFHRSRRSVLELDGDNSAGVGELVQRGRVVVRGDEVDIGNPPGGGVGVRIQHGRAVTHRARSDDEVEAQLAAAEDAQHGRRGDGGLRVGHSGGRMLVAAS